MALQVSNESVLRLSNRLWTDIQNMAQFLTQTRALVLTDSYAKLLDIPFKNAQAQDTISFALGLGITPQLKTQLDIMTGSDVTIAEISSFWNSVNNLATAIKANNGLFGIAFNDSSRVEYTSTMTTTQRNFIIASIDTALGYIA